MSIDYTQRPSLTYQELLDTDSHEVPEVLRWFSPMPPSEDDVPVERGRRARRALHHRRVPSCRGRQGLDEGLADGMPLLPSV